MTADAQMVLDSVLDPTSTPQAAQIAFDAFLARLDKNKRVAGLHDSDADGVTAGVVWQRALERLGYANVARLVPGRERNAWAPGMRSLLQSAAPDSLFVMDLGSQPVPVLDGVPT